MQDGSFLENENNFFEDDSINETKTRLLSMPNNFDIEELLAQADIMKSRPRFASAIRCLTLAIDKTRIGSHIWKMKREAKSKSKLLRIFVSRAECYFKIAQKRPSSRHADMALYKTVHLCYILEFLKRIFLNLIETC